MTNAEMTVTDKINRSPDMGLVEPINPTLAPEPSAIGSEPEGEYMDGEKRYHNPQSRR